MHVSVPTVELLFITPNAAQLIEAAGRTAYRSEDKITDDSADAFVAMIAKRGHHSVLEHAYASFRIVTDRGISHEIVRHRLASYTQESTRYCNYRKAAFDVQIAVLEPSGMNEACRREWEMASLDAEQHYMSMIEQGATPGQARSVLPTCLRTEIVMTANFREWLHFLALRTAAAAHADMQIIAKQVGAILVERCPSVFGAFLREG